MLLCKQADCGYGGQNLSATGKIDLGGRKGLYVAIKVHPSLTPGKRAQL